MWLDKNSSRKNILKYIKSFPLTFLTNFLYKTWAQPYMGKAAKEVIKDHPTYFLINFSNKPWAQPYIDEAAKGAAKENPKYFLEKWSDVFPHHINLALFALGGKNVSG